MRQKIKKVLDVWTDIAYTCWRWQQGEWTLDELIAELEQLLVELKEIQKEDEK